MTRSSELVAEALADRQAATYATAVGASYPQRLKLLLLERLAHATDRCLDIGVANGVLARPLARRVREVHGVDLSRRMLEECTRLVRSEGIGNIRLHRQSASALAFRSATFDLVYAFSTLLMVPDFEGALSEISRVLRVGGIAILDVAGKYNLNYPYWRQYYRRQGHFGIHALSLPHVRRLLKARSLSVIEHHPTGVLDQWRYVPLVRSVGILDRVCHGTPDRPDLDARVSQRLAPLAGRWYVVARRETDR